MEYRREIVTTYTDFEQCMISQGFAFVDVPPLGENGPSNLPGQYGSGVAGTIQFQSTCVTWIERVATTRLFPGNRVIQRLRPYTLYDGGHVNGVLSLYVPKTKPSAMSIERDVVTPSSGAPSCGIVFVTARGHPVEKLDGYCFTFDLAINDDPELDCVTRIQCLLQGLCPSCPQQRNLARQNTRLDLDLAKRFVGALACQSATRHPKAMTLHDALFLLTVCARPPTSEQRSHEERPYFPDEDPSASFRVMSSVVTWEQLEPIVCELNANAPKNRRRRKLERPLVTPVDTLQNDCPLPSKKLNTENSQCSSDEKILFLNIVPSDTNSKVTNASPLVTPTDDRLSPPKVQLHTSPPENNNLSCDAVKTTGSSGESSDLVWDMIKLLRNEVNDTASTAPNIETTNSLLQAKERKNEKRKELPSPTIDDGCLLPQDHVTDSASIEVLSTFDSLSSNDRSHSVVHQTDQVDAEYLREIAPMQQNARKRCVYEFVCEINGLNCYNKKTVNIREGEPSVKLAYAFPGVNVETLPDRYPCLVTLGIAIQSTLEKETFEVFGAPKLRDAIQAVLINHTCANKKTNDVYVVKTSSSGDTNVPIDVPIDDNTAKDEVILVRRPECVVLEAMRHSTIHAWRSGGSHYLEYHNDTVQRTDRLVGLGIPKWHTGYVAPLGCGEDLDHSRNLLAQIKTLHTTKEVYHLASYHFKLWTSRKFRTSNVTSKGPENFFPKTIRCTGDWLADHHLEIGKAAREFFAQKKISMDLEFPLKVKHESEHYSTIEKTENGRPTIGSFLLYYSELIEIISMSSTIIGDAIFYPDRKDKAITFILSVVFQRPQSIANLFRETENSDHCLWKYRKFLY